MDMTGDINLAATQIMAAYAGRDALWREGAADSVRDYALRETGLFPWQLDELRARLKAAGCVPVRRATLGGAASFGGTKPATCTPSASAKRRRTVTDAFPWPRSTAAT